MNNIQAALDRIDVAMAADRATMADRAKAGIADAAENIRRANAGAGGVNRPTNPYRQVSSVRSAVSRKAKSLGSMPVMISNANDRLIESGPLWDLIDKPNPRMGTRDFWQTTSAWIDLTGVCHWVFTQVDNVGKPTEIMPVGGWQMKPLFERRGSFGGPGSGDLVGWDYRAVGKTWQESEQLPLDRIWSVGEDTFDQTSEFGYSSPLEAAGLPIAQIFKADLANEANLDNGVVPSGVFTMPGKPSETQIKEVRADLEEKNAGVLNRLRPMLLYGGMDWKAMSSSFSDMEFSTLQKMKITDVCAALDIMPAAIGYVEGGRFEFVKAAINSLWIDTTLPRACWLADEFNRGVVSHFENDRSLTYRDDRKRESTRSMSVGRLRSAGHRAAKDRAKAHQQIFIWFDDSRVPAIRQAMLAMSKEGAIWITDYKAPPAQVIEALDLPLEVQEHQKVGWQKVGEMRIDEPIPGMEDPTGPPPPPEGEDDEGDEGQDEQSEDTDMSAESETASEASGGSGGGDLVKRELSENDLARIWLNWRGSWSGIEKQMQSKVNSHFRELRKQVLRNLDAVEIPENKSADMVPIDIYDFDTGYFAKDLHKPKGVRKLRRASLATNVKSIIGQILFNLTEANNSLTVKVFPLIRSAFGLGGQQSMDEAAIAAGIDIEEADPFNIKDPHVDAAMRARTTKIKGINRTLRKRLSASIADGLADGESTGQIAQRIRKEFNLASSRARTIAMTEIGGAVEDARHHGRNQARVPSKSWLWSRKETGRPWHGATEDKTMRSPVANNEQFTIVQTGNKAQYPRGSGTAEDDINCGCTTIARYPGDKVKDLRLIRHYKLNGFTTIEQLEKRAA